MENDVVFVECVTFAMLGKHHEVIEREGYTFSLFSHAVDSTAKFSTEFIHFPISSALGRWLMNLFWVFTAEADVFIRCCLITQIKRADEGD